MSIWSRRLHIPRCHHTPICICLDASSNHSQLERDFDEWAIVQRHSMDQSWSHHKSELDLHDPDSDGPRRAYGISRRLARHGYDLHNNTCDERGIYDVHTTESIKTDLPLDGKRDGYLRQRCSLVSCVLVVLVLTEQLERFALLTRYTLSLLDEMKREYMGLISNHHKVTHCKWTHTNNLLTLIVLLKQMTNPMHALPPFKL